jgi:hypothetical protein
MAMRAVKDSLATPIRVAALENRGRACREMLTESGLERRLCSQREWSSGSQEESE